MSQTQINRTPIALTIAGSDSGGGAGIQADLKTFSALGAYGASVVTAVTAQNTVAVTAIHLIPPQVISAQIEAVIGDLNVSVIKIGMLSSDEIIKSVANGIAAFQGSVVLDPVMVAKSGDKLLQPDAVHALKSALLPKATLLTPNLPEAAALLGCEVAGDEVETLRQGRALCALGAEAVLMKGGHGAGEICVDWLVQAGRKPVSFSAERIDTHNTHGTGCTLSAAVAACLGKGISLEQAVAESHAYLHQAIRYSDRLRIGQGHGPVHHFHGVW